VTASTVVCVLGMHRSGTSLVTAMLKRLGLELGSEDHQMPASPNNPRGYFENQLIVDLNDELLARFGGTWSSPPVISAEAHASPALSDLRRAARRILDEEFRGAPIWGWKDPRTCLLVPFWELLAPSPRYVICLRNPADVARSLARSDGITHGFELWIRYMSDSLVYTLGKPRLIVFYDDIMRDWRRELSRLASFVDLAPALEPAAQAIDADRLVDPGLRHHEQRLGDTLDDPRVPFPAKALYVVTLLAHGLPHDGLPHGALESLAVAGDRAAAPHAAPAASEGPIPGTRLGTKRT
jgi:hypothetical protein